jgi:hypothetical protein
LQYDVSYDARCCEYLRRTRNDGLLYVIRVSWLDHAVRHSSLAGMPVQTTEIPRLKELFSRKADIFVTQELKFELNRSVFLNKHLKLVDIFYIHKIHSSYIACWRMWFLTTKKRVQIYKTCIIFSQTTDV